VFLLQKTPLINIKSKPLCCNRESHFGCFCCEYVWSILQFFYRTSTAAIFSSSVTAAADLPSSPYTIRPFVSFCSVRFATESYSAQNEITLS